MLRTALTILMGLAPDIPLLVVGKLVGLILRQVRKELFVRHHLVLCIVSLEAYARATLDTARGPSLEIVSRFGIGRHGIWGAVEASFAVLAAGRVFSTRPSPLRSHDALATEGSNRNLGTKGSLANANCNLNVNTAALSSQSGEPEAPRIFP